MSSLKSPCMTSCWSSIETIYLNRLLFEKTAFYVRVFGDRQTDERTDGQYLRVKPRICEHGLMKLTWAYMLEQNNRAF